MDRNSKSQIKNCNSIYIHSTFVVLICNENNLLLDVYRIYTLSKGAQKLQLNFFNSIMNHFERN